MAMAEENGCGHGKGGSSGCSANEQSMDEFLENQMLRDRMATIRNKIIVMSGKGGVGKSTVAVNVAVELASRGMRVGLLDVDIHGPSVPGLLNLSDARPKSDPTGLQPIPYPVPGGEIKVMSMGFLLGDRDAAVIWRGPMKMGAIKQFLTDVAWGELDYLIIDSPPGTGDEPLSVCQLIDDLTGAIIVTTPQKIAINDVRKSITFCHQVKAKVLGVIENMSGFVCPKCGERIDVFTSGGGETMAREMGVPFLGRIPLDPKVVEAGDQGTPIVNRSPDSETSKAYARIVEPLLIFAENIEKGEQT
jgi:ATP-binding protein involved in chromosome partitioning